MKKISNIFIVIMLLTSISSFAIADSGEDSNKDIEVDPGTEQQLGIMNNGIGAEIRLLQLEKAIEKNIIKGEDMVNYLTGLEIETLDLEAILAELELVKEEVAKANPNSIDAVEIFVDLKHDAVNLTKDFRNILKELLDDETLEQLRQRIKEMVFEQNQNLSNKIQNKIRQFNKNNLNIIFNLIGQSNETLLSNYQNGNLSIEIINDIISKTVNEMSKEKKYNIFSQIKQNRIKNQIKVKIILENITENFQERMQQRLSNRLRKSEHMLQNPINDEMVKRIRNRIDQMNNGDEEPGNNNTSSGNGTDTNDTSNNGGNDNGLGDGNNSNDGSGSGDNGNKNQKGGSG